MCSALQTDAAAEKVSNFSELERLACQCDYLKLSMYCATTMCDGVPYENEFYASRDTYIWNPAPVDWQYAIISQYTCGQFIAGEGFYSVGECDADCRGPPIPGTTSRRSLPPTAAPTASAAPTRPSAVQASLGAYGYTDEDARGSRDDIASRNTVSGASQTSSVTTALGLTLAAAAIMA